MTDSRRPSQPCPYYCCSDFDNAEEQEPDWTADLSNDIHPTFQNITFGSEITKEMQSLTTQSLRLASRFLTMDSVSLHILTMAEGEIHIDKKKPSAKTRHELIRRGRKANTDDIESDRYLYVYPKQAHRLTSPHLRRDANTLLSNLEQIVDIHISTNLPNSSAGRTYPEPEQLPQHLRRHFPRGCRSLVIVNGNILQNIIKAKSIDRPDAERLLQLRLAKTLCHELGHALSFAVYGPRGSEPMKQSAWAGEAGFDLEAAIMGGRVALNTIQIPEGPHSEPDRTECTCLTLEEWPSNLTCVQYLTSHAHCAINARPAPFTVVGRLGGNFVADLFHEEFWNRRKNSPETLRPKDLPTWIVAMSQEEYGRVMKKFWVNEKRFVVFRHQGSGAKGQDKLSVEDDLGDLTWKCRVIEHDEEGLDEHIAQRLRDIIRRQWQGRHSRDPADIMDSAVRPWSRGKDE